MSSTPTSPLPRWIFASIVGLLVLSLTLFSSPGFAVAQDEPPDSTPEVTGEPEVITADDEDTAAADTPTEPGAAFVIEDELFVIDGPLNVRESGSLDADVLFQLDAGESVTVTSGPEVADDYTWYEIGSAGEGSGWAVSEFLGTEDPTISPPAVFAAGDEAVVTADTLNVRDEPSIEGEALTQLDSGTSVTIMSGPISASDYTWYQVQVEEEAIGWVAGEFLSEPGAAAVAADDVVIGDGDLEAGDSIRTAADGVNLRDAPGLDGEVVDTLTLDALFLIQGGPVEADGYTWYQVFNFYYGEGWVAGEVMTLEPNGFPADVPAAEEAEADAEADDVDDTADADEEM